MKPNSTKPRMPRRPKGFETTIGINVKLPKGVKQARHPRNISFVLSYVDYYVENDIFLHALSKYWVLYSRADSGEVFDGESPWNQIGYAKRGNEKPQVAAAYLLLDFFKQKKDYIGLDEAPGLAHRSLLPLSAINAIWNEVWGEVPTYGYFFVENKDKY